MLSPLRIIACKIKHNKKIKMTNLSLSINQYRSIDQYRQYSVSQQRAQLEKQRQILNHIGIDYWISRSTLDQANTQIVSIVPFHCHSSQDKPISITEIVNADDVDNIDNVKSIDIVVDEDVGVSNKNFTAQNITVQNATAQPALAANNKVEKIPVMANSIVEKNTTEALESSAVGGVTDTAIIDKNINNKNIIDDELNNPQAVQPPKDIKIHITDNRQKIRPFHIQAMVYRHWLLLVELTELQKNIEMQTLWDNICQVLAEAVDQLRFPLITDATILNSSAEPMDTVQLANASLAGFIFRMMKTEQVKLAKLTPLAEGLYDERFVDVPTLKQMLTEPKSKRQFWQTLSSTYLGVK